MMSTEEFDPLADKAHADLIVERAADQLRRLLQGAVQKLDPFPPFPGAFFTYGIEVELPGFANPERGCVVLGPDGELYELELSIDFSEDASDPVAARDERLKKLDLHPCDYVVYAYHALTKVVELLLERAEAPET
jgi:hypothetical protein